MANKQPWRPFSGPLSKKELIAQIYKALSTLSGRLAVLSLPSLEILFSKGKFTPLVSILMIPVRERYTGGTDSTPLVVTVTRVYFYSLPNDEDKGAQSTLLLVRKALGFGDKDKLSSRYPNLVNLPAGRSMITVKLVRTYCHLLGEAVMIDEVPQSSDEWGHDINLIGIPGFTDLSYIHEYIPTHLPFEFDLNE